ncbi:DUF1883 domain-containing protein [Mycolicibacterium porcinum]
MEFSTADLGYLSAGSVVHVTIQGDGPNVRIFDNSNFRSFKSGQRATGYGGRALRSPVSIEVPHTGHWHLVIDFGGLRGRASFSYQVMRAA